MTIKTQRLIARAKKLTKKGHLDEAQKIYLAVLKSSPKNHEAKNYLSILRQRKQTNLTQKQLDEVMKLYSSGQMSNALAAISLLIEAFPNEPLLFNISGACYSGLGPIDLAIINFEKAIALNPKYAEAHYNLGAVFKEFISLIMLLNVMKKR